MRFARGGFGRPAPDAAAAGLAPHDPVPAPGYGQVGKAFIEAVKENMCCCISWIENIFYKRKRGDGEA